MTFKIENCRILLRRKKGQTITAILVTAPFFDDDVWIPWACVHDDSEIYKEGDVGTLRVADSWAEKKGWE